VPGVKVGFDAAPIALSRAGERRYALSLLNALRERDDLELTTVNLSRRTPRSFAQRLVWQAAAEGLYYPLLEGRQLRAAGVELLHQPRHLVPMEFGVRLPRVLTIHDVLALRMPEHFSRLIAERYRVIARRALRRADLVVTGSSSSRDDVVELLDCDPGRIRVTPYGVEDRFRPVEVDPAELEARFGLRPPFVACVGTLEPRKNLVGAIRAFERVQRSFPDHTLAIVGGQGWKSKALDELLAGTGARVALTGYVADDDLPLLYSAADCFLFPSFGEGFGFPLLEAMACGTAAIAGDNTSLPELAGDAALLVDSSSTEAIAAALEQLLGTPELRERLAARGLERSRGYTWAGCAEETVAVYRELVAE
jgi:glycosyltransferase involved in cell wall biosynthesis